ncbi:MAG: hypothetical protein OK454_05495, partial [Thaumarchaeota archaeon]|nr:hypothetical protein [Nitrososphaerota archaeon]
GEPVKVILPSLLFASPFMLAHEISDFVFFSTVAPLLYVAVRKVALRQGFYAEVSPSVSALETEHI